MRYYRAGLVDHILGGYDICQWWFGEGSIGYEFLAEEFAEGVMNSDCSLLVGGRIIWIG